MIKSVQSTFTLPKMSGRFIGMGIHKMQMIGIVRENLIFILMTKRNNHEYCNVVPLTLNCMEADKIKETGCFFGHTVFHSNFHQYASQMVLLSFRIVESFSRKNRSALSIDLRRMISRSSF